MTVVSPTFHLQSLAMPPKSNANSANSEETGARPKTTPRLPAEETAARPTPRMPAKPVAVVRPSIKTVVKVDVIPLQGRGYNLMSVLG